jgi:hypothetical protein
VILLEAMSFKTLLMVQECDYPAGHSTLGDPGMLQVGWASLFRWSRNAITRLGAPVPSVIFIGIMCSLKPVAGKAETNVGVFSVRL